MYHSHNAVNGYCITAEYPFCL